MKLPPIPKGLQHLPQIGDFAVPWITEWARPNPVVLVEEHPLCGPTVGCDCVVGEGKPIFKYTCYARQREAMEGPLCGVCGKDIKAPYAWFRLGDAPLFQEPASHPACLAYALAACPHLYRVAAEPTAQILMARRYHLGYERTAEGDGEGLRMTFGKNGCHTVNPDGSTEIRPYTDPDAVPMDLQHRTGYFRNYIAQPDDYTLSRIDIWKARQREALFRPATY